MSNTKDSLLKIAVVGPESTGKSTMAQHLAKTLDCAYVPEYARYYCKNLKNAYTLQDETNMFYGQIALEEAISTIANNNIIICDTTILTVKIWCDHLFEFTPKEVLSEIKHRPYDLYLLMNIDLPWEDDPLRDFPDKRDSFLQIWQQELHALNANFVTISGIGNERLENGLSACLEHLNSTSKS